MRGTLVAIAALAAGLVGGAAYLSRERAPDDPPPAALAAPAAEPGPRFGERRPVEVPDADRATGVPAVGSAPWVRANNDGVAALEAGDPTRAVAELERALELAAEAEPRDAALVRGNLAEALARRARVRWEGGERAPGLADLERAVELDPERDDLARAAERWRTELEVEAEFASYASQRFEVVFDGDRIELLHGAQETVELLEAAYGELWLFFGHDPVERGERLVVVLYEPEDFRRVTGLGHWAGGAYDGRVRVPIADFEGDRARWTDTLWHELCHAFLHDMVAGGPPGWLDEGLAQWLEPGRERAVAAARASLTSAALLPLADLSGTLSTLGDPATIRRAYAQSLAFTDHLVRTCGEYAVREMLRALAEGGDAAARFQEVMGYSLDQALADLGAELDRR